MCTACLYNVCVRRCGDRSTVFSVSTHRTNDHSNFEAKRLDTHISRWRCVSVRWIERIIVLRLLCSCDVSIRTQRCRNAFTANSHIRIPTYHTQLRLRKRKRTQLIHWTTGSHTHIYMRVEAELQSHSHSHHHESTINSAQHVCCAVNVSIRNAQSTQYTTCFTMRCINISTRPTHHSFHSTAAVEWSIFLSSPGSVCGRVLCVGEMKIRSIVCRMCFLVCVYWNWNVLVCSFKPGVSFVCVCLRTRLVTVWCVQQITTTTTTTISRQLVIIPHTVTHLFEPVRLPNRNTLFIWKTRTTCVKLWAPVTLSQIICTECNRHAYSIQWYLWNVSHSTFDNGCCCIVSAVTVGNFLFRFSVYIWLTSSFKLHHGYDFD